MRDYLQIEGTQAAPRTGDRKLGKLDPQTVIQATVEVRPQSGSLGNFVRALALQPRLDQRTHLSREDFAAHYGASPDDLGNVKSFAKRNGLKVIRDGLLARTNSSAQAHRSLELRGTIAAFSRAFQISFYRFRGSTGSYRTFEGNIQVPSDLQGVIRNVFGFDTRKQLRPRLRRLNHLGGLDATAGQAFSADQVGKLYNFPEGVSGKNQVIAIVEMGGGFRRRDFKQYLQGIGLALPSVEVVPVAGGRNAPKGDPNSADGEVMLDIEVAAAIAPGATFVFYFARNTNRGFFRAVNAAVHDNKRKPTIISISWGGAENSWRAADMDSMDQAFQAAAAMGISVFVAAGDGGSSDDVAPGNQAHCDFPASSPFVTACGGTRLQTADGVSISGESVWNDGPSGGGSGGGVSAYFPMPVYQSGLAIPPSLNPSGASGRGIPDVAGNADPWSGYKVRVDSQDLVIGGTSAVAPLWAGLTALLNEGLGRQVGFLNPLLYTQVNSVPGALNDIVSGNNDTTSLVGGYTAVPGYDVCTGLGTPNGQAILDSLK